MSDIHQNLSDIAGTATNAVADLKAKGSRLTESVTHAATALAKDATALAKDNAEQVREAAQSLAGKAQEKVEEAITQRRSAGADYIGSIAQATDQAAQAFENDLPEAARYIRIASEKIQDVADTVRERDMRELIGTVQDFARNQPTLFFGGAMVLGFAALRFLKSSAPTSAGSQREDS